MRKFTVVNKETDKESSVDGEEALAELLDIPLEDIPTLRVWKWTVSEFVVYEEIN